MVSVECWWNDTEGKVKYLEKTCPKDYVNISQADPGFKLKGS